MAQLLLFPDPRPLVERLGRDFFRQLPERPGVYLMHGAETVLYVGKAKSLRHRLGGYRVANPERMARRTLRLLRLVERIAWEECADESSALRREAELLLELKPRFNRAGVWRPPPKCMLWRQTDSRLELLVADELREGWNAFGPSGGGLVYVRTALMRLLWLADNAPASSALMPAGWIHGRLPGISTLNLGPGAQEAFSKLLAGNVPGFVTWIADRTHGLERAYDAEIRDADLETVANWGKRLEGQSDSRATTTGEKQLC
jgi:predicted GIY-YIG superfamily endonuclease